MSQLEFARFQGNSGAMKKIKLEVSFFLLLWEDIGLVFLPVRNPDENA
jgi:hypothetical protein